MVIGDVGVEIGPPRLDHDLAQQPGVGELVERVVDRSERDWDRRGKNFAVQLLGGDVPIALGEQEPRQGEALARRPQPHGTQPLGQHRCRL